MRKLAITIALLIMAVFSISAEVLKTRTEWCSAYNCYAEVILVKLDKDEENPAEYDVMWTFDDGTDTVDIYRCKSLPLALALWVGNWTVLESERTFIGGKACDFTIATTDEAKEYVKKEFGLESKLYLFQSYSVKPYTIY